MSDLDDLLTSFSSLSESKTEINLKKWKYNSLNMNQSHTTSDFQAAAPEPSQYNWELFKLLIENISNYDGNSNNLIALFRDAKVYSQLVVF